MSNLSKSEQAENDTPNNSAAKLILIADDEPFMRHLLQRALKFWGYRTLVAQDGKQAMEIDGQHPGEIDVLLSDVTMPGINGVQLAAEMTKHRPALKVILMSGFSHFHVIIQRGWKFIQKPFRISEVKDALDEVL